MNGASSLTAIERALLARLVDSASGVALAADRVTLEGPQSPGLTGETRRAELLAELGAFAALTGALVHAGLLDEALLGDRRVEAFERLAAAGLLPDSEGAFGGC